MIFASCQLDPSLPKLQQHLPGSSIYATVSIQHNASRSLKCGFRQACSTNHQTAIYAGIKSEDGCIVEGTSGINRLWFIDSSTTKDDKLAPLTPYTPDVSNCPAVSGSKFYQYEFNDIPASSYLITRTNSITKKTNYLISFNKNEKFNTFFFVEDVLSDGSIKAVPILGFDWNTEVKLDFPWQNGENQEPVGTNRVAFGELIWDKIDSMPGFSRINVASADPADNMNKKINDVINSARNSRSSNTSYSFEESGSYTLDVVKELKSQRNANIQFMF